MRRKRQTVPVMISVCTEETSGNLMGVDPSWGYPGCQIQDGFLFWGENTAKGLNRTKILQENSPLVSVASED